MYVVSWNRYLRRNVFGFASLSNRIESPTEPNHGTSSLSRDRRRGIEGVWIGVEEQTNTLSTSPSHDGSDDATLRFWIPIFQFGGWPIKQVYGSDFQPQVKTPTPTSWTPRSKNATWRSQNAMRKLIRQITGQKRCLQETASLYLRLNGGPTK